MIARSWILLVAAPTLVLAFLWSPFEAEASEPAASAADAMEVAAPRVPEEGEIVATLHESFNGSVLLDFDERCLGVAKTRAELAPHGSFTIPETYEDADVTAATITTHLANDKPVGCVMVRDASGRFVHRGLLGECATRGTFPPGVYDIWIGTPGTYALEVDVELAAL